MHPQYHLDLHHDRARSLQRDAHQRRPRGPFKAPESGGWVHAEAAAQVAGRAAANLRSLRGTQGLSTAEVAERAGVSPQTVTAVEGGRVWPDIATLTALALAVGVPPADLIGPELVLQPKRESDPTGD